MDYGSSPEPADRFWTPASLHYRSLFCFPLLFAALSWSTVSTCGFYTIEVATVVKTAENILLRFLWALSPAGDRPVVRATGRSPLRFGWPAP